MSVCGEEISKVYFSRSDAANEQGWACVCVWVRARYQTEQGCSNGHDAPRPCSTLAQVSPSVDGLQTDSTLLDVDSPTASTPDYGHKVACTRLSFGDALSEVLTDARPHSVTTK